MMCHGPINLERFLFEDALKNNLICPGLSFPFNGAFRLCRASALKITLHRGSSPGNCVVVGSHGDSEDFWMVHQMLAKRLNANLQVFLLPLSRNHDIFYFFFWGGGG